MRVMDWKFEQELEPLRAETVGSYVRVIQREFMQLLHQTTCSDDVLRARLCTHEPFSNFSKRYPTIFSKITKREFASSPRLMSLILFEIFTLERLQKGELTEDGAKQCIAKATMDALTAEASHHQKQPTAEQSPNSVESNSVNGP